MPNLMKTVIVLAPWLATQTYACPYLITPIAVSSVSFKKVANVRMMAPATATRPIMVPPEAPVVPPAHKPSEQRSADFLLFKDDAWRSASSLTPENADAEISDARLLSTHTVTGQREWEVESPITFKYRIREETDVFDPSCDALLYGHLTDEASLARAKSRPLKRVVVVDENVHALYGERIDSYFAHHGVEVKLLVLPTDEEHKDMEMVLTIAEAIHELGIDRRLDPVIAIGGGVCMDIVGFAASIYRRRTPYVRVPTTLMGYVDASVGAKSGVNFAGKKNKLGAYLPPALTVLDRSFLATLDQRQLSNGAAEIAKMALVKDPELFELLASHGPELLARKFQGAADAGASAAGPGSVASRVLNLSIQSMLEELAPNLWEDSLVRLVDFGHVFSMELEMAMLFDDKLYHGEAVAVDMAFCAVLAHVRGHVDRQAALDILSMLRGLGLPTFHAAFDEALCAEALYERVKFSQGQKVPLPTGRGEARIFDDITEEQVHQALALWRQLCA